MYRLNQRHICVHIYSTKLTQNFKSQCICSQPWIQWPIIDNIRQWKVMFLNIFFSTNLNFEVRMSILPLMIVTLNKSFRLRAGPNPNKVKYSRNINGTLLIVAFIELSYAYFFCLRLFNWQFFEPIFTLFNVRSKINLTFHDDN